MARQIEKTGEKANQFFIGCAVNRRRGEPDFDGSINFTADFSARGARLHAHRKCHISIFGSQSDHGGLSGQEHQRHGGRGK